MNSGREQWSSKRGRQTVAMNSGREQWSSNGGRQTVAMNSGRPIGVVQEGSSNSDHEQWS